MKIFNKKHFLTGIITAGLIFNKAVALTPAGTIIGNSATAIYFDENNNQYTTTSNIVQTTVQEVCGVELSGGGTYEGTAGQTVYVPFVIKNTGNGENSFNLQLNNVTGTDHTKTVYIDLNQNGVVDPGEQSASTITLGINESKTLLVTVTIGASETSTDSEEFKLTGSGTSPSGCSADANATVNVITDALIQTSISVDKDKAKPGDVLNYEISFKNVGTQPAKSKTGINIDGTPRDGLLVVDDIPTGSTFKSGSVSGQPSGTVVYSTDGTNWSTSPTSPVNYIGYLIPDPNDTDGNSEDVFDPNQQGTFKYQVTVNDPFDDTDGVVDNKAKVEYANSSETSKSVDTNEVHTVIPTQDLANISIGGLDGWTFSGGKWTTSNTTPTAEKDFGTNYQNDNYINKAPAGYWIEFKHTAKNNSIKSDLINIETLTSETNLPSGAIVEFWNGNGTAKLIDTNADGKVDLGNLDPNSSKDFIVKIFIPANTPQKPLDGTVDYYVTIQGSSKNNTSVIDKTRDNIDGIIAAGIDVGKTGTVGDNQNNSSDGNTDGTNDSDDILPSDNGNNGIKDIINPGETATYPIEIVNTGASPDLFNLNATGNPLNSTVKFFTDPNCDGDKSDGVEIVNSSLLAGTVLSADVSAGATTISVYNVSNVKAGDKLIIGTGTSNYELVEVQSTDLSSKQITLSSPLAKAHTLGEKVSEKECLVMVVETTSDTPPGENNLIISIISPNSGASDTIDAYLKVNELAVVVVAPDHSDQLPPGGTTTYQHVVTNTGNTNVDVTLTVPSSGTKLSYVILDENKNPSGTSLVINNLSAGDSKTFYVKVLAPTNIPIGTVESIDVTAAAITPGGSTSTDKAKDTTTIIEGYMQLTKIVDKQQAKPGEKLTYTIKYKNIGSNLAKNVVITDPIPANTDYVIGSLKVDSNCDGTADSSLTDTAGDDTAEYDSTNKTVVFRVGSGADSSQGGTVNPGEEGCVIFKVKIK